MNDEKRAKLNERQQRIQELAYYNWQNAGSPMGRCMEFWLEAEKEIDRQDANSLRVFTGKFD
jgi:hypothetical protein